MNRNDFDPSSAPTEVVATQFVRNNNKAFGAGVATGFALCGLLLGSGFVMFQWSKQSANQAILPDNSQTASVQPAPVASAPSAASTPTDSTSTTPATAQPSAIPTTPVATGSFQTQGNLDGSSFTVQVLELRRTSGNMLLLRMNITNTSGKDISPGYDFTKERSWDFNVGAISGVYVVDANAQKKYEVMRDAKGTALASKIDPALKPNETREVYVQLPAPPATTQRLTIYFPKTTSPIFDVPITQ